MKKLLFVSLFLFITLPLYADSDPIFTTQVGVDSSTEALEVIDYEHHEIHAGSHYIIASSDVLGSGITKDFCTYAPDTTKWIHIIFEVAGSASTSFDVFEAGDFDDDGISSTPLNSNRNSSNTAGFGVSADCTVNSTGTRILNYRFGSGTNPSKALSGENRSRTELVLKQDTNYLWRIRSNAADNNVTYVGSWYEHVDKN